MSRLTLYHNPGCSKSRALLQLLQARGLAPEVIPYLQAPPGKERLRALAEQLGRPLRDLVRTAEAGNVGLQLDGPDVTDEELLDALVAHPVLLQRPILVADGKAAIGRPPEAALALL